MDSSLETSRIALFIFFVAFVSTLSGAPEEKILVGNTFVFLSSFG